MAGTSQAETSHAPASQVPTEVPTALASWAAPLLAPIVAELGAARLQIADQDETIGQLRAQLAAADAKTADSANLDSPRPWWQRWLWWRRP
jgi:hypothetical protein